MEFSKAKCKVVHMGQGNPKRKYRLGGEWVESSPEEKDLGVLVGKKHNMTRQCALAAQKANRTLGCIPSSVASRSKEGILPLCSSETPPSSCGALSARKTWSCCSGARGGHKNDPRAGTPLL